MKHTVGVLKVTVVKAEDLTASDPNGKSDPFCVLHFNQQEENTPVVSNSLNPKWNYTVRLWCWGMQGYPDSILRFKNIQEYAEGILGFTECTAIP